MNGRPATDMPASAPASPTIGQALAAARARIASVDACVLLSHALRRDAAYLIAHAEDALDRELGREFEALIARRTAGEPVAYITGRREFFGLEFKVTPAVLIPRPETELLVELALERIPTDRPFRVLDLGTGSGCVAASIAVNRPQARVMATDRSREALAVAQENAHALGARNVGFAAGGWFVAVGGRCFDLIVSNPPYVAEGDPHLHQGDLRFEPRTALTGGTDGLDALRLIAGEAHMHLAAGGWIICEHGHDQGRQCRAMLEAARLGAVFTHRDFAGIERVSGGQV